VQHGGLLRCEFKSVVERFVHRLIADPEGTCQQPWLQGVGERRIAPALSPAGPAASR
jgi:hypothetical protein